MNLCEVVRQTEPQLIAAVNELCHGRPSANTIHLMDSLRRDITPSTETVYLFGTNFDVNYYNVMKLDELQGERMVYSSKNSGIYLFCMSLKFIHLL